MNCLFEMIFLAWCKQYDPQTFPHAKDYVLYAFREGLQLGMCLMSAGLGAWTY